MSEERKMPPLHARLHRYKLTPSEFLVLKAMVEHCWDGTSLWASVARIAAYSKLDDKTVQRVLHGYTEKRKKAGTVVQITHIGLIARGILTLVQPAIPGRRRSATYQLNEAVLELDPQMKPYLSEDLQAEFEGMDLPTPHGKPIRPRQKRFPGMSNSAPRQKHLPGISTGQRQIVASELPGTGDTVSQIIPPDLATNCPQSPVNLSPNYLRESLRDEESLPVERVLEVEILDDAKTPVNPTTTATQPPEQLKTGLRELVPYLDERAIDRIWNACRQNVTDVTAEEVLCLAWIKRPAIERAENPAGLLIHSLPIACNPASIDRLRAEIRRADDERQAKERRERELIEQAEAALAAMPDDERAALEARISADVQRHLSTSTAESQRAITQKLLLEEALRFERKKV